MECLAAPDVKTIEGFQATPRFILDRPLCSSLLISPSRSCSSAFSSASRLCLSANGVGGVLTALATPGNTLYTPSLKIKYIGMLVNVSKTQFKLELI